jgi:hypothetical protein
MTQAATRLALGQNHKMIERIYASLFRCRQMYVEKEQHRIKFGLEQEWKDVEADEVDMRKSEGDPDVAPRGKPAVWEQWGGVVERGNPRSLVLTRLPTRNTRKRAPGPGPIRKRDWKKTAEPYLKNRSVILHTDGAKAYKLKLEGVLHDNVVHKKKKVMLRGKPVWIKPKFTKIVCHRTPSGSKVWCQAGTQIIDRVWSWIKTHLKHNTCAVGSNALRRSIRSAQWTYWHRGKDLWLETGSMLKSLL